jgi:hypothetical protein
MMCGASADECRNFWGKNTIDPSGQGIEKPRKVILTFNPQG